MIHFILAFAVLHFFLESILISVDECPWNFLRYVAFVRARDEIDPVIIEEDGAWEENLTPFGLLSLFLCQAFVSCHQVLHEFNEAHGILVVEMFHC